MGLISLYWGLSPEELSEIFRLDFQWGVPTCDVVRLDLARDLASPLNAAYKIGRCDWV